MGCSPSLSSKSPCQNLSTYHVWVWWTNRLFLTNWQQTIGNERLQSRPNLVYRLLAVLITVNSWYEKLLSMGYRMKLELWVGHFCYKCNIFLKKDVNSNTLAIMTFSVWDSYRVPFSWSWSRSTLNIAGRSLDRGLLCSVLLRDSVAFWLSPQKWIQSLKTIRKIRKQKKLSFPQFSNSWNWLH